ncbi:MAG: hypothetical protein F6K31_10300 [Symploca sp. SIO2G7]|nr:hypothetical protein [Symploca sp. SIO2G7]
MSFVIGHLLFVVCYWEIRGGEEILRGISILVRLRVFVSPCLFIIPPTRFFAHPIRGRTSVRPYIPSNSYHFLLTTFKHRHVKTDWSFLR